MPLMIDLIVIIAPAANVYAETGMLMLAGMNLIYVFTCFCLYSTVIGMKYWKKQ